MPAATTLVESTSDLTLDTQHFLEFRNIRCNPHWIALEINNQLGGDDACSYPGIYVREFLRRTGRINT